MGNTTFSGPVRSENGFEQLDKNATTGKVDNTYYLQRVGRVAVGCTASADSIVTFTQPANTLLSKITIVCTSAPTITSGDIGFEVGTTSSGVDIVAAATDDLLDGGTTVEVGAVSPCTLVASSTTGAATHTTSIHYAAAERSIFCNITTTTAVSVAGEFTFLIEFDQCA
tara:strand:+ start:457 stop:963 length:507 start_codon:yes stop_codon:yes gene_type:complete